MAETKTRLQADDLLRLPDDGWDYELRGGELIRMAPPGGEHGQYQGSLYLPLATHVRANGLGIVVVEVGFRLRRDPDTVRGPDISFVSRTRVPSGGAPVGYWELAPDLAVEVISPSESAEDVREKIDEYLTAGSRLVWIVYPRRRSVEIWRADGSRVDLREGETLSGEDVVPGFTLPVADIFADW
jgi:Uma2 family endonuclease